MPFSEAPVIILYALLLLVVFATPDLLMCSYCLVSVIDPQGPLPGVLGAASCVTVPRFSIISLPIFYYLRKLTC